jgi:hypothetical protein
LVLGEGHLEENVGFSKGNKPVLVVKSLHVKPTTRATPRFIYKKQISLSEPHLEQKEGTKIRFFVSCFEPVGSRKRLCLILFCVLHYPMHRRVSGSFKKKHSDLLQQAVLVPPVPSSSSADVPSPWVIAAPLPVLFFLARPRLRWFLLILLLFTLLTWGERYAGSATIDTSTTLTSAGVIRDVGFALTRSWHASLAAAPHWVLDVLALLNTLSCIGVIGGGLLSVLRDGHYGVAVCLYSLLTLRLLLGCATALPRSAEYLYSWYDQPNAMSSTFIFLFSGHCVTLTLFGVWLWITAGGSLRQKCCALLVHACNAGQWAFMLTTRGHYTVDLLLGVVLGVWGAWQVQPVTRFCQRQEEWLAQHLHWRQQHEQARATSRPSLQQEATPRSSITTFRAQYRQRYRYPAWLHVGGLALACLLSLASSVGWILWHPSLWGWVTCCCISLGGMVLANGLEYVLHGLWQHASHQQGHLEHHRFFTAQGMHADSMEDVFAIIQELHIGVALVLVILPCLSIALGWLLALLLRAKGGVQDNGGTLLLAAFLQVAFTLYYVFSELVHYHHHRPPPLLSSSPWWRLCSSLMQLPPLCWLQAALDRLGAHHRLHHDPAYMQIWNRNINFPLFDVICRTRKAGV